MLKIGQLAKHAGLTVRALHHYDNIGLLRPSVRTDAGYRLYDRDDVARLHQIQALRQLGMALADIGSFLAHSGRPALAIVERQLLALDRQIDEAARMRDHLKHLQARLARGDEPALADWLTILEQMNMYDKYFSKDELANLAMVHDAHRRAEWEQLVADAGELLRSGAQPYSLAAKQLGQRWLHMLERDTGGDAALIARLDTMHDNEPSIQHSTGIYPEMKAYIAEVIAGIKLDAYAKHLLPNEVERMRRHQRTRGKEWMPLFDAIRRHMATDPSAHTAAAMELSARWSDLFGDMVGTKPEAIARFRTAVASEPVLRVARGMKDDMIGWLRAAVAKG